MDHNKVNVGQEAVVSKIIGGKWNNPKASPLIGV